MAPRGTENNAYDKQRALWYVIVFSGAVNCSSLYVHIGA